MTSTIARFVSALRPVRRRVLSGARALRDPDVLRDLAPLVVPLALAPWLWIALPHYATAELWNDVTAMNYAGWCVRHGVRMYDGVALPDGPFAFALHALFTWIAGTGSQAFRRLDLVVQSLTAVTLACLLVPRSTRRAWLERATWAVVAASLWLAQLMQSEFGTSCQREGYWVALGTVGICLVYASWEYRAKTARWMLLAGALVAGWMMFGKPTGVIYPALAVFAALLLPRDAGQPLRWRLRWVGSGMATAVVSMLGFVLVAGSLHGFYYWYVRYVLDVYRYFQPILPMELFAHDDLQGPIAGAVLVLFGGVAAVAVRALPPRALVFAVAPVLHAAAGLAQMKGYMHQFVPVRTSIYFFYVLALIAAWTLPSKERGAAWSPVRSAAAVAVTLLVGFRCTGDMAHAAWLGEHQQHVEEAWMNDTADAARYIREHSDPADLVLFFDNDARIGLEAGRRPAIPELMTLMLDHGPVLKAEGKLAPSPAAKEKIEAMQRVVQADACERVLRERPAVMVFGANEPPFGRMFGDCAGLKAMFDGDYRQTRTFGSLHVFLIDDHP